jgi:hypothetical protein
VQPGGNPSSVVMRSEVEASQAHFERIGGDQGYGTRVEQCWSWPRAFQITIGVLDLVEGALNVLLEGAE